MKRILVYLGSAADLLYFLTLIQLGYKPNKPRNSGRVVVGFNGTLTHSLGESVLPILAGMIIALVPLTMIDEPLNFNAILGRTWMHAMKALPFSYHQRLSFLTLQGQVDINGDQPTARACCALDRQEGEAPAK